MAETPTGQTRAEAHFAEWFRKNYPPDTTILNPDWHAPRIMAAVLYARNFGAAAPATAEAAKDAAIFGVGVEMHGPAGTKRIDPMTVHPDRSGIEKISPTLPGMSLRDWFAGQALAGLASAQDQSGAWTSDAQSAAAWAYEIADAMLAARKARS